jgi:hypothetical protein
MDCAAVVKLRGSMKSTSLTMLCVAAVAGSTLCGCGSKPSTPPAAPVASEATLQALRASLASALEIEDPYQRVHQLATLLPGIETGSGAELKHALVVGSKMGMGAPEYELLVRSWAAQDPQAAVEWLLTQSGSIYRIPAIELAVAAWASKDPADAVANVSWAAQTADRELAQAVQQGIVRGWFQVDRPGLEKYIEGLGGGIEQQRSILAYLLAIQRSEGSDAVMRWAEAVPEENVVYKRAVFREVAMALAWSDPPAAERWCEAQCEGPYGKALRSTIVRVRIQNSEDGTAVMKWVTETPESESQLHALRIGFQLWAIRDEPEALAWMEQNIADAKPWVPRLYGAYARQLAVRSPARGIEWAEKIEAPDTRQEMLVRIARKWRRQDPAAADAWIEKSELSEKQREAARDLSKPDFLPKERTRL